MTHFRFSKSARLLKSAEFDRVFRARCTASDRLIVVYAARNEYLHPRLGLTVSRKLGNAVVRNRWKRSLREAFRLVQHELPAGLDIVVLPQPRARPQVRPLQASLKSLTARLIDKLPFAESQGSTK